MSFGWYFEVSIQISAGSGVTLLPRRGSGGGAPGFCVPLLRRPFQKPQQRGQILCITHALHRHFVLRVTPSGPPVNNSPIASHSGPTIREFEHVRAKWNPLATRDMRPTKGVVQSR
jgi:hypothetical protein